MKAISASTNGHTKVAVAKTGRPRMTKRLAEISNTFRQAERARLVSQGESRQLIRLLEQEVPLGYWHTLNLTGKMPFGQRANWPLNIR